VVSLHLRGRGLHRLPVAAGHFMNWRFLDGAGWSRSHPYSLSAAPRRDQLRITVKESGDPGNSVMRVRPGTRALFEGPYGRLTEAVRTRRKVTMLASGIGITPLRALLEDLSYAPGEATLIYRASAPEDLVFKAELDMLAHRRGARVFYVVGPRVRGRRSWLPVTAAHLPDAAALRELVPDIARHDVFVCGAPGWMDAVRDAALAAGVPAEHIHTERFGW